MSKDLKVKEVYLKITTVPQTPDLSTSDREFELFFDKYEEAKSLSTNKNVLEAYHRDGGLNPLFGKIYSATIGFVDGGVRMMVLTGDEDKILKEIVNLLSSDFFKDATLVGWNFSFLLPFITTRMMKHRLDVSSIPAPLRHMGLKPWNMKQSKDLQDYVEGIGWFKSSLDQHAFNLGLETSIIKGSEVYTYLKNGLTKEIEQSDVDYIFTLVNIDRLSSGGDEIKDLTYKVKDMNEEAPTEVVETPPLEQLYRNNEFSKDVIDKILALKGKKKLTKKDKSNLFTILRGVYLRTDFVHMDQDSKKVIAAKEEEIHEFINDL